MDKIKKIIEANANTWTEAFKEFVRMLLLAALPVLYASVDLQTMDIHLNWLLLKGALFLALLRAADKWVHENPKIKANGISPV